MDTQALEQLEQEFTRWRAGRQSKYERVPKALLKQARQLATAFPELEICRRTRLARRKLFPQPKAPRGQFVELPGAAPEKMIEVEIRRGARVLTLRLSCSTDLSILIPLLGA